MAETKNVLTTLRKDIMKKEIEKKCPHCGHIFSFDFITEKKEKNVKKIVSEL